MPDGVIAEVIDGVATVEFTDPAVKGPALQRLLDIGGPGSIETLTREGPRRRYRVPEGNAAEAGLLDDVGELLRGDTGFRDQLVEANEVARANPSRPDAPTSANAVVGTTTFKEARETTGHVATTTEPDTGSGYAGSHFAPPHADVITHVASAQGKWPVLEGQFALAEDEVVMGEPQVKGPVEEAAGEPPFPPGDPSEEWTRKQLTAYADVKNVDTKGLSNKRELLDALRKPRK
jgi:hypothetical protein